MTTESTAASNMSAMDHDLPEVKPFDARLYDNVTHKWENKAFAETAIRTFFGAVREDRMDHFVHDKRAIIADHAPESWDPEGLVLTDVSRPFKSRLLFSISEEAALESYESHQKKADFIITHSSGTDLSKVYEGDYGEYVNWVDDAIGQVKEQYHFTVHTNKDFYVCYPSVLEHKHNPHHSVVVFFIKVAD